MQSSEIRVSGFGKRGRDAGRGYGFGVFEALGDGQVQCEKLGQQVLLGGEAVGGEDGGVQGGVGVFERIRAGQFEGAVEGAQAAFDASATPRRGRGGLRAPGLGYRLAPASAVGRLRPREGVEDGFGRVAKALCQLGALGDEPQPVGGGLQDAEAVVVGESEARQSVIGANRLADRN